MNGLSEGPTRRSVARFGFHSRVTRESDVQVSRRWRANVLDCVCAQKKSKEGRTQPAVMGVESGTSACTTRVHCG